MPHSRRHFLAGSAGLIGAPSVVRARETFSDAAIGQMLMLGFAGDTADAPGARTLAAHIAARRVGGVCFLGHNVRSRSGVLGLTALFNAAGGPNGVLVAIDHEGGAVQRLGPKLGYPYLPGARAVAAQLDPASARALYRDAAKQVRAAGFNLNLAPVVDLGFEPRNPPVTKWGRAFGADGPTVSRYASAFLLGCRDAGLLATIKHFPGHGSTLIDSHNQPVDVTTTWRDDELTPYRTLSRAGVVDVVMTGHLVHRTLTDGEPATLSHKAVTVVLRGAVGHQGVVMTDDLDMAAIRSGYGAKAALIKAVAAGHDLVLMSNSLQPDPDLPIAAIGWIREGLADGRIAPDQIRNSGARIAAMKSRLRTLPSAPAGPAPT